MSSAGADDLCNELDVEGERNLYRAFRYFWHPVMYASELLDQPKGAVLLGEQLVLVRLQGEVCAFPDRCAHRGTALSLGCVEGNYLRCPYHGWTYGSDGVCSSIPARFGMKIPKGARLRRYLATEQAGLIWVCLEDDPVLPAPEFEEFDNPEYHITKIPAYDWDCSAPRRVENYVDFAHFAWVHDGLLGSREYPEVPDAPVWRDGSQLRFEAAKFSAPLDANASWTLRLAENAEETDRTYRLYMPLTVHVIQRLENAKDYILFMSASPVGPKSTRTFTFNARNYAMDESEDEGILQFEGEILAQDQPVVESQRPEELPTDLTAELHIRGADKVSIEYRRWLIDLAQECGAGL